MATKKREIYARVAVQLRTHERALRAERACPGAMGMYLFLLLDARGEETAGDVAEVVALASWGGGERYRAKQIEALVAVGLIERREDRLVITKYDEHNDTPADIAAARRRARERMQAVRANKQRTPPELGGEVPRTSPDVPISSSSSISISGSDLVVGRSDPPDRSPTPPEWFVEAAGSAAMAVGGEVGDLPARWASYRASRARKGWAQNHEDAVGWLCDVVRSERARAAAARSSGGPKGDRQPLGNTNHWLKTGTENDL
jgi:hypothetical protein